MSGVNVYCPACRKVEHFTAGEAERLIYGLQAALADEECEPGDGPYVGDDPTEHLYGTCASYQLGTFQDGEVYYEHIDAFVTSRRAAARTDENEEAR